MPNLATPTKIGEPLKLSFSLTRSQQLSNAIAFLLSSFISLPIIVSILLFAPVFLLVNAFPNHLICWVLVSVCIAVFLFILILTLQSSVVFLYRAFLGIDRYINLIEIDDKYVSYGINSLTSKYLRKHCKIEKGLNEVSILHKIGFSVSIPIIIPNDCISYADLKKIVRAYSSDTEDSDSVKKKEEIVFYLTFPQRVSNPLSVLLGFLIGSILLLIPFLLIIGYFIALLYPALWISLNLLAVSTLVIFFIFQFLLRVSIIDNVKALIGNKGIINTVEIEDEFVFYGINGIHNRNYYKIPRKLCRVRRGLFGVNIVSENHLLPNVSLVIPEGAVPFSTLKQLIEGA
jgi:hypothetical protein